MSRVRKIRDVVKLFQPLHLTLFPAGIDLNNARFRNSDTAKLHNPSFPPAHPGRLDLCAKAISLER